MKKISLMLLLLLPVVAKAEVSLISVHDAAFGTVELLLNHVKYTPKKDFYGVDKFTYTIIHEETGREASGYFFITIQPVPEELTTDDLTVDINEDTVTEIPIEFFLNDNNANVPDPVVTNPMNEPWESYPNYQP